MPDIIINRRIFYRIGYTIISVLSFWSSIIYARQSIPNITILISSYCALTISFFVIQASDPGYLNQSSVEASFLGAELPSQLTDQTSDDEFREMEDDRRYPNNLMFCRRCDFSVPIRSHHCRECNRCVSTFDHHCPVIGTCIGERNQCRFWWFLFLHFLALWWLMDIVRSDPTDSKTLRDIRDLIYWLNGILWSYISLILGTQTWFAVSATTTYECSKSRYKIPYLRDFDDFDLPFTRGLCNNLNNFCCQRDKFFWDFFVSQSRGSIVAGKTLESSAWRPIIWPLPSPIIRDSTNICDNMWQNKYYSCC